jgi:hypothetical protein
LIPGTPANSNWTRQLAPIQSQFQPGVPPLLEGGVSVGDAWGFWVSNPEFPINSGDFDNLGVGGLYVVPNGQYNVTPGLTVPCITSFAGPGGFSQMVISSGDPAQPINIACSEILTNSNTNLQISSINGAAPGGGGTVGPNPSFSTVTLATNGSINGSGANLNISSINGAAPGGGGGPSGLLAGIAIVANAATTVSVDVGASNATGWYAVVNPMANTGGLFYWVNSTSASTFLITLSGPAGSGIPFNWFALPK